MNIPEVSPSSFSSLPEGALPTFRLPTPSQASGRLPSADSADLGNGSRLRRSLTIAASERSLGERLFDATAEPKIWTSRVAMHLDLPSRDRFFKQLDRL